MNLPNQLTVLRILLTPAFAAVFFIDSVWGKLGALAISLACELTDLLDGILARRMNLITDFGKLVDPLADSMSRFTFALCLVMAGWGDLWMILVLFYRDSLVASLRVFSAAHSIVMAARSSGKVKAIFQFIVINLVLIFVVTEAWIVRRGAPIDLGGLVVNSELLHRSGWWAMVIMAAVTGLSGVDYIIGARQVLRKLRL
ncbi:MAG: CDP-alcohol phosphatidyltransferase family protein [Candidatus Brocadiae bacterium]|nr:CDP-alcohol phosphatidyltransferase family protein [Candidatus Brocadiia bacterium]